MKQSVVEEILLFIYIIIHYMRAAWLPVGTFSKFFSLEFQRFTGFFEKSLKKF